MTVRPTGAVISNDPGDQYHAFPQAKHPSGADELRYLETVFFQQRRQGTARPELDVPTFPQRRVMAVPLAGQRNQYVFQPAVIGCRHDEMTARFQHGLGKLR